MNVRLSNPYEEDDSEMNHFDFSQLEKTKQQAEERQDKLTSQSPLKKLRSDSMKPINANKKHPSASKDYGLKIFSTVEQTQERETAFAQKIKQASELLQGVSLDQRRVK